MRNNKNPELHIVNPEDLKGNEQKDQSESIRRDRKAFQKKELILRARKINLMKKTFFLSLAVLLLLIAGIFYITGKTYSRMEVLDIYEDDGDMGEKYVWMDHGILKYSRDGATYISQSGKEQWNVSYQIKDPVVSVKKGTAAVADHLGKEIHIFSKEGQIGEIKTDFSIEKIAVSSQGIVSAILKDNTSAKIVCYDTQGNVLVEHQTSPAGTGYPMDLELSDDGNILLVSYLKVNNSKITSEIAYYNFEEKKGNDKKIESQKDEYKNKIIPFVTFFDGKSSAVVMDGQAVFYHFEKELSINKKIKFEGEIRSVFSDDQYLGIVVKGKDKLEVQLFDKKGKQVLLEEMKREYREAEIQDGKIIMYDHKNCEIITKSGVHKFKGEFEKNIMGVFPASGFHKYLIATVNGIEKVRLTK